jgi:hypothetical protein
MTRRQLAIRCAAVVLIFGASGLVGTTAASARPEQAPAFGTIFTVSSGNSFITEYAPGATGNATPINTIEGAATGIVEPGGIAVDSDGGIYVSNLPGAGGPTITEYPPSATGNATPTETLAGDSTFNQIFGITLAPNGNLWVSGRSGTAPNDPELAEYAADAVSGDPPIDVISGDQTGLSDDNADGVMDVAVTPDGADVWATTVSNLLEFSTSQSGNAAPVGEIGGTNTDLHGPAVFEENSHVGLTVDGSGNLWTAVVANDGFDVASPTDPHAAELLEFSTSGAEGNIAPIAKVSGHNTGFSPGANGSAPDAMDVSIDAAGNLWASDSAGANGLGGDDAQIGEFPGNANGDVTPDPLIVGSGTGLSRPTALAVYGTAPSAPTSPVAVGGNGQVAISWSAPVQTGGAILGYRVLRASSLGGAFTVVTTVGAGSTSYTNAGLANGTRYYYEVEAFNGIGIGDTAPRAATPDTTAGAPTGLKATASNASVTLKWHAPTSDGGAPINDYSVLRSSGTSAFTPVGLSATTMFTDPKLVNGKTYIYEVEADNPAGQSLASNPATATPQTVPSAPRGVKVRPGIHSVVMRWVRPPTGLGARVTGYVVQYATCKVGAAGCKARSASAGASATSLTIKKLSAAHKYFLDVIAESAAGSSSPSARVSAKPKA